MHTWELRRSPWRHLMKPNKSPMLVHRSSDWTAAGSSHGSAMAPIRLLLCTGVPRQRSVCDRRRSAKEGRLAARGMDDNSINCIGDERELVSVSLYLEHVVGASVLRWMAMLSSTVSWMQMRWPSLWLLYG